MFTESDCNQHADWHFLQDAAVNLFWRREYLDDAIESLRSIDYRIERIDCLSYKKFQADVSRAFRFEESFGYPVWTGNFNALDDAMRSVFDLGGNRAAVALTDFDALYQSSEEIAHGFADVFERNARNHLLYGRRMIALIQSNDPHLHLENLRPRGAIWNKREWLFKDRGL